jgi:glycosyltransferase involved in cell wall biosynthesis
LRGRIHLADRIGYRLDSYCLKHASAVVAPTNFVANEIRRMGVQNERLHTIPYPISDDFIRYGRDVQKSRLSSPTIMTLSPVNHAKGVDTLASAIQLVTKEIPNAHFLHIGKDQDHGIARLLKATNNGSVTLLGPFAWPLVSGYYSSATLVVSPSRFETAGYTLLEAMIHGKAVVASRVGGMTDLIEDGKTGLLVDPGDPNALANGILRLLGDKDLRQSMGEAGRRRVREIHGLDQIAERKLALYHSILDSKGKLSMSTSDRTR